MQLQLNNFIGRKHFIMYNKTAFPTVLPAITILLVAKNFCKIDY